MRSDITTVDQNFEALWIEIDTIGQPNLVCGILYRHPNGNLDKFMEYMNLTIEKIHQENKLCLFMGDFDIDLLKIDTHITSEKLNSLVHIDISPGISFSYILCIVISYLSKFDEHSSPLLLLGNRQITII